MSGNNIGYAICLKRRGSHSNIVNLEYIEGAHGTVHTRGVQLQAGPSAGAAPLTLYTGANSEVTLRYPITRKLDFGVAARIDFHWDAAELPSPSTSAGQNRLVPFRYSIKLGASGRTIRRTSNFLYVTNIGATGQIPFDAPSIPDMPDTPNLPGSGVYNQIQGRLNEVVENAQMAYAAINSLSRAQLVAILLV